MWWVDDQHVAQLALLAIGSLAIIARITFDATLSRRLGNALFLVAGLSAAGSTAAYVRFFEFHGWGPKVGTVTYHYHDIYHYAVGAKYYPELGYELLYECTWLAFQEKRDAGQRAPNVEAIRSLRSPDRFYEPAERLDKVRENCHGAFSDARWAEFQTDISTWTELSWTDDQWKVLLGDLGLNPPPSWAVIAHNLANTGPLTHDVIKGMPFLDIALILLVGGAFVGAAFGRWGLVTYLILFGTNWLASYRWTGGSYCRQLWFVFLTAGVSLLQLRWYTAAGIMLGMSTSMRIFPGVFAVGALWSLLREARRGGEAERRNLLRFTTALAATGATLFGASLVQFGPARWLDFVEKMEHHGTAYFMWHIGYKKYAVYYPDVILEVGFKLNKGWKWANGRVFDGLYAAWWPVHLLVKLAGIGTAAALSWRLSPPRAALLLGGALLYFTQTPANYYYVYLATFGVVFVDLRGGRPAVARVALLFATMLSVSMSAYVSPEPFVMNGWVNRTVFWFFVAFLGTFVLELPSTGPALEEASRRVRAAVASARLAARSG